MSGIGAVSAPGGYRPDIDGLRAVAVGCVVAYHNFPKHVHGGFIGVDIFFVISGFLITSILAEGLEHGRLDFGAFYARRIRRIFPALAIVLASCLVIGAILLDPNEYKALGLHVAGGVTPKPPPIGSNGVGWRTRGALAGLGGSGGGGLAARLGGEGLHERLGGRRENLQDVETLLSRGGDDRSQAGENLGAFQGSERAGDFHPDLHHSQVLFGQIVGEGDVEIGEKP